MASVGIYAALVRAQIRSYTAYRASFLIDASVNAMVPLLDLLTIIALFQVTPSIGGFSADEVLVMFGISTLAFAPSGPCSSRICRRDTTPSWTPPASSGSAPPALLGAGRSSRRWPSFSAAPAHVTDCSGIRQAAAAT